MKIYTKTGDEGKTGLIGGTRISKNDLRIEAYGTVDELNSFIGVVISLIKSESQKRILIDVQRQLFAIGSILATDLTKQELNSKSALSPEAILKLETEIDKMDSELERLNKFILPGGSLPASYCHVCRSVTRRAERRLYDMTERYPVEKNILVYFNRLSDYFFVLARYELNLSGTSEFYW